MEKVLITGASGFIGRNLLIQMNGGDYELYALSRFPAEKENAAKELTNSGVNVVRSDILSSQAQKTITDIKPNVIVHSAGLLSRAKATYDEYKRANVDGTLNVLNAAKAANVSQFIYISSGAVYEKIVYLPIDEKHPTDPFSPYGKTKLEGENVANSFRSENMKLFIPRLFNTYGPGQNSDLISKLIKGIDEGKQPVIYGDGSQKQDFIYISDTVAAIEIAIRKRLDLTLNIGTGKPTTLIDLVNKILLLKNSKLKPYFDKEKQPGPDNYADTTLARRNGIESKINIDEGLEKLIGSSQSMVN